MIGRTNSSLASLLKNNANLVEVATGSFTFPTAIGNYSKNINLSNLVENDYYLLYNSSGDTSRCLDDFKCTVDYGKGSVGCYLRFANNPYLMIFQPTKSSIVLNMSWRRFSGTNPNMSWNVLHIENY